MNHFLALAAVVGVFVLLLSTTSFRGRSNALPLGFSVVVVVALIGVAWLSDVIGPAPLAGLAIVVVFCVFNLSNRHARKD